MLYIRLVKLISMVLCTFLLVGFAAGEADTQPMYAPVRARLGVFSWQKENATDEKALDEMLKILVQVGASEVYQYMDAKTAPPLLKRAHELQIDVYVLRGRREWSQDPDAMQMLKEVDRVAALMAQMGDAGPAGLILDVEPYHSDAYRADPDRIMREYLSIMRRTYAYAVEAGVPLILCIPRFYDTKGYIEELNALVEEASDAVAVMNYYKKDESGQIKTEIDASRRVGKRLIHVYELQQPGIHDLTERNTYHDDGLSAVWKSIDKLKAHFNYDGLTFALHDYTALREMLTRE